MMTASTTINFFTRERERWEGKFVVCCVLWSVCKISKVYHTTVCTKQRNARTYLPYILCSRPFPSTGLTSRSEAFSENDDANLNLVSQNQCKLKLVEHEPISIFNLNFQTCVLNYSDDEPLCWSLGLFLKLFNICSSFIVLKKTRSPKMCPSHSRMQSLH